MARHLLVLTLWRHKEAEKECPDTRPPTTISILQGLQASPPQHPRTRRQRCWLLLTRWALPWTPQHNPFWAILSPLKDNFWGTITALFLYFLPSRFSIAQMHPRLTSSKCDQLVLLWDLSSHSGSLLPSGHYQKHRVQIGKYSQNTSLKIFG